MIRGRRGPYGHAPEKLRSVGQRIRAVRLAWKWSQFQLAEALGTSQQTISHWERDRQQPTDATLRALAALFGMGNKALLTGAGFRVPDPPRQLGGMLVAEAYAADLIHLPVPDSNAIALLQREDERVQWVDLKQALEALRANRREGRPVWVVLG